MSLLDGTLLAARRALTDDIISPRELAAEALERIRRLNPKLNAFLTVTQASENPAPGVLCGIPIAHKDCFATRGVRTTGGSKILAERVPDYDAAIVTRLHDAGAVMLGKTNLHELCYGITSNNPHFGAVRNPWDLTRIPGGSSGGSAAAVAAGMVFAASGTDTGGSIRVPASFCGVVGLKPTYGAISRRGCLPLGITLDHVGPIAKTVRDAGVAFAAMCDGAGAVEIPDRVDVKRMRIGVPEAFFFDQIAPEVRASVRHAVQTMAGLGAEMREVRMDGMEALNRLGRLILSAEASSLWRKQLAARPRDFGEDVRAALERGLAIPAVEYLEAQRRRRQLANKLAALWNGIDCLLTPATPTTAPKIGDTVIRVGGVEQDVRAGSTRLVRPFNVLGWPALAMPCGFSEEGLPVGLQLVAAPRGEARLFQAAAALEDALGIVRRKPPIE